MFCASDIVNCGFRMLGQQSSTQHRAYNAYCRANGCSVDTGSADSDAYTGIVLLKYNRLGI